MCEKGKSVACHRFFRAILPRSHDTEKSDMPLECLKRALLLACLGLELFWHPIPAQAQEATVTRQEFLKQQRTAKAQNLHEEKPGALEKTALYIQNKKALERLSEGWKDRK